jgi:NAD(P)-dependent dehydrogenase (short-subunit alcohol dehydrogenase family)
MTSETHGRVLMIVGAGSGIGLAVAQQASARGDTVVVVGRDDDRVHTVADELPGEALPLAMDVLDDEQVRMAVASVVRAYGRIDAVVTTAQVMAYGRVEEVPPEVMQRVVDTGIAGTHHLARHVLPVFRSQGHGTLVVVNSLLAEIAVPSMGAYNAAKWGQLGLVRALQTEVRRERGLHVCLVMPGAIDTPIYHQAATYAGSRGSAPPPVISPHSVASSCLRLLDHPRRMVHAGPVNRLAVIGFRLVPGIYDRLAGPLVNHVVLRGPSAPPSPGNVHEPVPDGERLNGGWTLAGRLRGSDGRARWSRKARRVTTH